MTLRNRNIDNSVRYMPISEKTKEKDTKSKPIKTGSLPRKQNKTISRNSKRFGKNFAAGGFGYLNWIKNCYF